MLGILGKTHHALYSHLEQLWRGISTRQGDGPFHLHGSRWSSKESRHICCCNQRMHSQQPVGARFTTSPGKYGEVGMVLEDVLGRTGGEGEATARVCQERYGSTETAGGCTFRGPGSLRTGASTNRSSSGASIAFEIVTPKVAVVGLAGRGQP